MYSKWYFKYIYSNVFLIAIHEFCGKLGGYMTQALLVSCKLMKIKIYTYSSNVLILLLII